ncbi:GTP-binding protein [Chlorella sorokiniana]|uniref:GTP-binding protein n=1 Tax=Chlorella sorokiniana TaxID=3076 RepID=A0A2P6TVW8_CHLSO|nr:GTP-binding protein [Chlorella sorokiniana]|eukprot:PRW58204.1 GTP-binding protein [Chlorella sorokiniana]
MSSLLQQLARLARQYPGVLARPQHCSGAKGLQPASTAAAAASLLPPPLQDGSARQQRRAAAAAAGKRGNVFLDDTPQRGSKRQPGRGGSSDEPYSAAKLFDSSRFNYDSDEEEEEEEQQQAGSATDTATPAAAAAAVEQVVEVALPPPRGVRVKTAEFIKSSVNVEQCPPPRFPEFAVIGRSNVGKSSLINMLTGRSSLAMVSKTPGKTRCINHFLINGSWYLVDLPGYGYARTSKGNVLEWNRFTREYFAERETLVTVLLLIDASIPPMPLDISCAAWFAEAEIPFTVVFTKLDKRKKGSPPAEENIAAFEAAVADACGYVPPTLLTSSRSGQGRNELLAHVAQLREFFTKQNHSTLA